MIEFIVGFEFLSIMCKQRVLGDIGKSHSFLRVNDENPLEKILCVYCHVFYLLLLCQSVGQAEIRCAPPRYLRFHIVALDYR